MSITTAKPRTKFFAGIAATALLALPLAACGNNDDASTARLKGPGRPVNALEDRAGVLRALSCVDYVTSFGTDTATPLIERLRPDVYAKGGDYTPQMLEETAAVVAAGGQVRILDYVADKSTTAVVDRIRGVTP